MSNSKENNKRFRGVIYSRTVIVEDNATAFYKVMSEALESLEESGQMYGCSESVVSENDFDAMGTFSQLPLEYKEVK